MFDPAWYGVCNSSPDSEPDGEEPEFSTGAYISISDGVRCLRKGKQHQEGVEEGGRPING